MAEEAVIIPFPGVPHPCMQAKPKLCFDCDHAAHSNYGVFCLLFNESVTDERIAEECSEFKPA